MAIFVEIVVLLLVLIVLVLVHELGHFIVAKLCRMRVDEFGIGFPPRALTITKANGTEYTLNWLPFGGFVRIYGEDSAHAEPGAFASKPYYMQILVLIAGIVMNLIFAYLLLTTTLIIGTQQPLTGQELASSTDAVITIAAVTPNTPASRAGLQAGDEILAATSTAIADDGVHTLPIVYVGPDPSKLVFLISLDNSGLPMQLQVKRGTKQFQVSATPKAGVIPSDPTRPSLGVTLTTIGTVQTPIARAPIDGFTYTWNIVKETCIGLYQFVKGIVLFKPNFSQVSGPVGIASYVGTATAEGASTLLTLVAIISINLAIVNLIPVPALDGGRLLFVIIEAIRRKPINVKVAERVNMVGFVLLILLMVAVTAHDILNLFH